MRFVGGNDDLRSTCRRGDFTTLAIHQSAANSDPRPLRARGLHRHTNSTTRKGRVRDISEKILRVGYCRTEVGAVVASKVEKFGRAPLCTRPNQKIGSAVLAPPFSKLASFLFSFCLSFFRWPPRDRDLCLSVRLSRPPPSLSPPFIASLSFFFFLLFRSRTVRPAYSRRDARRGRMDPCECMSCMCARMCVCVLAFVPCLERSYNGDTCQNNWHTGVSNLPRSRWRTATTKESCSCVTAPRPAINEFPFGRPGEESSSRQLLSTHICIRQMFLLSREYTTRSRLFVAYALHGFEIIFVSSCARCE